MTTEGSGRRGRAQRGLQWVLLLAALVLLVVLVRSWQLGERGAVPPRAPAPLAAGEGAAVERIELQRDGEEIVLQRRGALWWMLQPIADLGGTRAVHELLRAVETLEPVRVWKSDSLASFELDPPRAILTLHLSGKEARQIRIGGSAPASGNVYASWSGLQGVAIVDRFFVNRFILNELLFWRERELLPPFSEPIDSVWVLRADEHLRAWRRGPEKWSFLEPADREANSRSCEQAVSVFWRFQFAEFFGASAPLSALGLDPPRATWIVFRGARADTLRMGARLDGESMAMQLAGRSPGRVKTDLWDLLTGGVKALEERHLLRGSPQDVRVVLLASQAHGLCYRLRGKGWESALLDPPALRRVEEGAFPDTAGLRWRPVSEPALGDDVGDLFEVAGSAWLTRLPRQPDPEAYPLRIHLWDEGGAHGWIYLDAKGAGAAVESRASGAGAPAFGGTAVGSRFPLRPMSIRSEAVWRWQWRLQASAR